jgi:hypothetical protein
LPGSVAPLSGCQTCMVYLHFVSLIEKLTLANYQNKIDNADDFIGFGFKTKTINDIFFDCKELDREAPELKRETVLKTEMFPPELAKILFEKYYK